MDLAINERKNSFKQLLIVPLLLLAIGGSTLLLVNISIHLVYSVGYLETAEQIIQQVKEENHDFSSGKGNKERPSIREEIEKAKSRLQKKEYKAAKSNYKRMVEHVEKLEKYRQDPMKYDNLGLLKKAPNEKIKQQIIESRIAHLEREIQAFYENIVKIMN